jgi:hypothetical protein
MYNIDLGDLQYITDLTEVDSLTADGIISGLVFGNLDSLNNNMNFELQNVLFLRGTIQPKLNEEFHQDYESSSLFCSYKNLIRSYF